MLESDHDGGALIMTDLHRRALAILPMSEDVVERVYSITTSSWVAIHTKRVSELCISHERLRAELQGAEILLDDLRKEVSAVVKIMDELSATWGDEGVFRRCRDRLRGLLPAKEEGETP